MKRLRILFRIILLIVASVVVTSGSLDVYQTSALYCVEYLKCRSRISIMHYKCNEQARKITGQVCSLNDDFRELRQLSSRRENNLAKCVSRESIKFDNSQNEPFKIPGTICERQHQNMITLNPDDCRLSVSNLKLGCEHLKSCCPVAKLCEEWIAEKTITKALKQKHIEINRKTMECRTSIRQKMSSSGDIITNATTEDTQAVLEAKLEDIITDWADDASGDGGVLNKSNRSVRIRTNKLYPPSYDFTRRSSQRGNFSEILRQRLHGFASFVDEINDIVEKYKQKRKKMSKISKKITVRRRENFTDTDESANKIDADSSESSTSTTSSSSSSSHHKKHSSSLLKNLNIVSMIKKNGKFIPGFTPFLANVDYNFRSNIRLKPPTNTSTKLTVISEIHNPNDTTSSGDMEENSTSEYSFITSSGSDSDSASAFTSTSTSGSNSMKSTNKKHLLKLHKSSKSLVSKDGQKQSVETINLDREGAAQNRKRNRHGEHAKSQRVNGIILKNGSEPASHINEASQSFSFVKEETSSADGESSLTNGTSVHVSSVSSKSASKSNASSKSAAKSARSGLEIITNAIRLPVNNLIFNEAKGKHSAATKVDTSSTDDIQRTINDVKQKVLQHAATHKLARIRIEPAKVRRKLLYRGEGTAVIERKRRPVWTSTLLSSKNLRRSSTHHHHNHRSQISTAADRLSLRKIGGTPKHHTKNQRSYRRKNREGASKKHMTTKSEHHLEDVEDTEESNSVVASVQRSFKPKSSSATKTRRLRLNGHNILTADRPINLGKKSAKKHMKNRKHTKKQKPLLTTTMATTTDQVVTSSLAPGEAYVDDQGLWTMVPTEASSSTTVPNDISSEEQANTASLRSDNTSRTGETSELEQKATTTESKSENTIIQTSEIDHAKTDDTTEVMERSKTESMIREGGENLISMNSSADHDHTAFKEHEQIGLAPSIAKEETGKTAVQSSQNVEFSWSDGKVPKHRLADHIQKNPTSVRGHSVVRTDIVEMPFGSDHKENRLRISSIPQPTMRETHTTTLESNGNESTTLQIDDKELTEVAVVLRKLMKSNVTLEQLAKLLGEDIDNSTSHSSQIGAQQHHFTQEIENNGLKNGATKMFLKSPTSAKHSLQTHYISRAEINESIERSNGINQNQLNNDLGNESKQQQQQNLDKLEQHFKPEETSTEIASRNSILTNISESFREDEPSKTSKKAEDAHHENRKENVLLAMDR